MTEEDGTLNSEFARRALIQCIDIIVESSIDSFALARRLYSEEIISENEYRRVRDKASRDTNTERLEIILDCIKDRIKYDAGVLTKFVDILIERLNRPDLADKIMSKYKDLDGLDKERELKSILNKKKDYSGLLTKSLKEGRVKVMCTKLSVSGPPGSGKSCVMKLLINEDEHPPLVHHSTPVTTNPEIRMVETFQARGSKFWKKIKPELLKEMVIEAIKHYLNEHDLSPIVEDTLSMESITQSPESLSPSVYKHVLEMLASVEDSAQLFESQWIYAIDSGGQAAFLDIAPVLLRYTSVNILTHKLNEELNGKAKFFYSIDGQNFSNSEAQQITHLQLLETSYRSFVSFNPPDLPGIPMKPSHKEPLSLVLGTFYDRIEESGESLDEKNNLLWSKLKPYKEVHHIFGETIKPLNAIARGEKEKMLADDIRHKICQSYIEADIPIRWFLFQLELEEHRNSFIIRKNECITIGSVLEMNDKDIDAALMYYHDLTIYLYFPEVLNDVVFLNPQPLLDILSRLISISYTGMCEYLISKGIIIPPNSHKKLKEKGIFSQDLLIACDRLSKIFSDVFSANDFLKLMEHLFILSPLPDKPGEYFLPCVLPMATITDLENLRGSFKDKVDPLVLAWIDDDEPKPLPQGLFPALVVSLLSRKSSPNFKLLPPQSDKPQCRNAIRLSYSHGGTVLLIDTICWLEVLYTGLQNKCYRIHQVIKEGINAVVDKFHYMHNLKDPEEWFHCSICNTTEHLCRLNEDKTILTCCQNDAINYIDETRQLTWLRSVVKRTVSIDTFGHDSELKEVNQSESSVESNTKSHEREPQKKKPKYSESDYALTAPSITLSHTQLDYSCESNKDIEIIVQPFHLECRYNETFQLECIAKSRSGKPITYKWIRKKPRCCEALHSEERVKNSVLSYSWCKHDILIFCCVVSIDSFVTEVVSNEAKVTVHSIWFKQQPTPVKGYIGQYALLHCEAGGKGPIQYLWLKEEGDRKVKVDQTCMEYGVLEFLSLQRTDWGQYICQVENEEEFVSSDVVTVKCKPQKKEKSLCIVTQPKSYVCVRDDSITLTCKAVSVKEICYQWYLDDKELRNETLDTLALSSINDLQFGSYHCVVTSGAESVTSDKANVVCGLSIESSKTINQTQTDQHSAEQSFQTADGKIYAREKIAILIGNKKYDCSEIKSLTNPHNDVMLLSDTLSKIGFKVFSFSDLWFDEIMEILDYFCRLLDSGVYCVFYYSGHGFSCENINYIMPVDVTLPISCDDCIPAEFVSYRLQITKSKVFMFLDCCRVSYDDKTVIGPTKRYQNECGFANIYKIWSCSASKPAYERASEESSVFNAALRNALEETTPAKNLNSKVLEYMVKKGLSKDGKEYQRPVAIIQLFPQEITLHEDVMYDRYMKESVKEFEQLYKKMHYLSPLHIGPDNLAGLATGDVKYTFVMTNILLVSLKLIKSDQCKELSVHPNVHLGEIHVAEKSMENPKGSRLHKYEFEFTDLQRIKNGVSKFLKIDAVNLTGDRYTYDLPTTLEACDFYCNDH